MLKTFKTSQLRFFTQKFHLENFSFCMVSCHLRTFCEEERLKSSQWIITHIFIKKNSKNSEENVSPENNMYEVTSDDDDVEDDEKYVDKMWTRWSLNILHAKG